MTIIFTTCTWNHIGRALSLQQSVAKHCPDARFIIGLLDAYKQLLKEESISVLQASDLGIPSLDEMCLKYDALELNSALKPYYAQHILKDNSIDQVIYLDSDILLYNDLLKDVTKMLGSSSVLISPHAMSSAKESSNVTDRNFLRSGIYNAGFFAIKNDQDGNCVLEWWKEKLLNHCYIDAQNGMFAEQLWMNLMPLYHKNVLVVKDPGYNVAYWNLHEREISSKHGTFFVNNEYPLMFYHFSGAGTDCLEKDKLSSHHATYSFTDRPDVRTLFEQYVAALKLNNFDHYNRFTTISKGYKTRSKLIIKGVEVYKKVLKRLFFKRLN